MILLGVFMCVSRQFPGILGVANYSLPHSNVIMGSPKGRCKVSVQSIPCDNSMARHGLHARSWGPSQGKNQGKGNTC